MITNSRIMSVLYRNKYYLIMCNKLKFNNTSIKLN